jgi:hypothetical protein
MGVTTLTAKVFGYVGVKAGRAGDIPASNWRLMLVPYGYTHTKSGTFTQ